MHGAYCSSLSETTFGVGFVHSLMEGSKQEKEFVHSLMEGSRQIFGFIHLVIERPKQTTRKILQKYSMVSLGFSIDFPWNTMGVTLWTMEHHGVFIEHHGFPWCTMRHRWNMLNTVMLYPCCPMSMRKNHVFTPLCKARLNGTFIRAVNLVVYINLHWLYCHYDHSN